MDVRLPDGTIIQNVPDGTTKAELTAKLQANGYDISKLETAPAPVQPSVSVAPAPSEAIPGPRQQPTAIQQAYQAARPYVAPTIEALSAVGGGLLGSPLGPAGAVAGAGLGYGIGKEALQLADVYLGGKAPRQGAENIVEPARNVLEGATLEAGGRVLGQGLGYAAGKLADIRSIPEQTAARIARNALGPDLPAVLNALRASEGAGVSAAQATADINSPTWQALLQRATQRDPRFLRALEQSQGEVSLNALANLAGGRTATATRAATEAAKGELTEATRVGREMALTRANLGEEVAKFETQAGKLSDDAAAKVEEVRRLIKAGDLANAAARLELIRKSIPVGFAKYTYPGELAKMADDWASKAATASLDLGQGARFNAAAAETLRARGIQPLEGDALVRSLQTIQRNPEFAGNDLIEGALQNVAADIAKWTKSNGIIDAKALDAIRMNSVNAAIAKLRPGADASAQRNMAAGVLTRIRPAIVDAIESAGGAGYRQYLEDYAKGAQKIAEQKLTGEALRLWKTNRDEFVRLVMNEAPETVEKFLGPGRYNIGVELAENALGTLQDQARKHLTNLAVKEQAGAGQEALKQLLLQELPKWRLPSYLSALSSTTNKALELLEKKVGAKTMATLTDALKTPESAVKLLETLPSAERNRVVQILSDPTKWGVQKGGQFLHAARAATGAAGINALAPDRYDNALAIER